MITLVLGLLIPWLQVTPQEPDSVSRLISALGDENAAVREAALNSLISAGPGVIPALQNATRNQDTEVAQRAAFALAELEKSLKLAPVLSIRPAVTLALQATPFPLALVEIAKQTGIRFRGDVRASAPPITATFNHAPLMEVLDVLGAASDLQWAFEDHSTVIWRRFAPSARPSCYAGGFKIALGRMDVYQSWDYEENRGLLWVYLDAYTEPGILPLAPPVFEVTELLDEDRRLLSRDVATEDSSPQGAAAATGEAKLGTRYRSNPFMVSHLDRTVKHLSSVAGTVKFLFPLDKESIVMDDLCEASTVVRGDLTLQATEILMNSLRLTVTSRLSDPQISRRIDPDNLVLLDGDGREHVRGKDFEVHVDQLTGDTIRFCVDFNDGVTFQPVSIRCTLVETFYEKVVPFEFRDVPLP